MFSISSSKSNTEAKSSVFSDPSEPNADLESFQVNSSDDDDSDDDTAALMEELARIKKERAVEKEAKQEEEKAEQVGHVDI